MAKSGVGVAVTIFPRHGKNCSMVADIDLQNFDLGKFAKLLGIEDEFDFFGGEWKIESDTVASYFEKEYGIRFLFDNFSYFIGAYSKGTTIEVTRDNFRSVLG